MIDFRVSTARDLKSFAEIDTNNKRIMTFTKIHFVLIMESRNELVTYSEYPSSSRLLEKKLWDRYAPKDIINEKDNHIANQWSKKIDCEDFGILFAIREHQVSLLGFIGVILLGIFASFLGSLSYAFVLIK